MFTGIVEEIGRVIQIVGDQERDNMLTIASRVAREGARLGDSIAINGTCLTVTDLATDQFRVGLSPETLRRTNLGQLQVGDPVNLERSLTFGGRMGGHYVQGHVDGIGVIVGVVPEGDAKRIRIQPPSQLMPYIVEKGYIAVDGVSLTVADLDETTFTIAMIAYTQQAVIMGQQTEEAIVNLEVDIIAKYVERLTQAYRGEAS
ncbi:riboflavin synthase [Candidatus Chloroploca asiatica]|uniref:Riboflavin synthase n=1 Tax=Candidatus Chloroploca asiatica TaxID=1506545 RepID=A0A2H3KXF8_9CHLR|nr:riboflavin synthase [Candidatus Chloroploca asiatica]PDW00113.1 riboflavin synthase subunit alpha [Candidatus Chloroploca asiatica]